MKPNRTGVTHASAYCQGCDWSSEARNAIGNAAQHAERTGHHVEAEQVTAMDWNSP